MKLPVHSRTVRNVLKIESNLVYQKRKKSPKLTEDHMKRRVSWTEKHIVFGDK